MAQTLSELVLDMAAEKPVITLTAPELIALLFSFSDAWQPLAGGALEGPKDPLTQEVFAAQVGQLLRRASLGLALHMQPSHFIYAAYFDVPVQAVQQFFLHTAQYEFILARPDLLRLTLIGYLS